MTAAGFLGVLAAWLRDSGIPFMLTGSVASAYHGAGRATMDVDVVIDPQAIQLDDLLERVIESNAYVSPEAAREALLQHTMFNIVDPSSGWKADLIVRKDREFSAVEFDRRRMANVLGVHIEVATVEDIILSKLEWAKLGGSARQLDDVRVLINVNRPQLDTEYLDRWILALDIDAQWRAADGSGDRR